MASTLTTVPATGTKLASDEYINKMYDANLSAQKENLTQGYNQNLANLDAEQKKTQQQTDTNLNRTYVEAVKGARNYNEVKNAYGLTSGAMAQARLAQTNQLNADMTALRGVQANADAEIERERSLLAKTYASEIAKAQAENDMARAEALYKDAKAEEERLWGVQENVANLFAGIGDYSYLQKLYGLTEEQMAQLMSPAPTYSGGSSSSSGSSGGYTKPASSGSSLSDRGYTQSQIDQLNKQQAIKDEQDAWKQAILTTSKAFARK